MNVFLVLALRYLAGRRLRTALTTLAVVFGAAVIFAVNALLPSVLAAMQGSLLGVAGQVDLTVSSASGETFDADALAAVRRMPGVAAAAPAFRRQAVLPTPAGAPLSLEIVGLDPTTAETVRRYPIGAGRFLAPDDDRAAVLTPTAAQALGLGVGDPLRLPTPRGRAELAVVGTLAGRGEDQLLLPLATMQQLFGEPGRINTIELGIAAGADAPTVRRDLERALGPAYRVGGVALESDAYANLQLGYVALNLFGLLTLFMGGFLIFNTFRTVVVERRRDLGLLRAVGATRRAVVGLIVLESALQGVVGTALGLLLGYGLVLVANAALWSVLEQYLRVRTASVLLPFEAFALAIGLGIGVTVVAGLLPALGASRLPVLAALKPQPPAPLTRRIGAGALVGGLLLVLATLAILSGSPTAIGLGALLFLAALVALTPTLVEPLAHLLKGAATALLPAEGRIAAGNLRRQPGRVAVTASALMIALAIIVALSGLTASIERTFLGYLDRSLASDILLLPPSIGLWSSNVGVGAEFEAELARVPGIGDWASLRYAGAQVGAARVQVFGIDPVAYPKVAAITFDQGDARAYAELARGRAAIVTPIFAAGAGLRLGDSVALLTPEGEREYRIAAIGAEYLTAKVNALYISQANLAADFHRTEDGLVLANLAPGADPAEVRAELAKLLEHYPQLTLSWGAEWRAEQRAVFRQSLVGLYVALVVLIVPSLLGLINTLAIGVLERTRELGVLRAVGATRGQVRRLVLAEALLIGAIGTAFGLLAGLVLGYALTAALAAVVSSSLSYSFPLAGLAAAVGVALALAVLASLLPARQAARLQIVAALQYE